MISEQDEFKLEDIIGVIFDFNGTCFFDGDKHLAAWIHYVEELTGNKPSSKEINQHIRGCNARQIVEHFLGYEISDEMLEQFIEEKEGIYRHLCKQDAEHMKLAPGLTEFWDYLAKYNIPRTIASTASLSNMMFYFEEFDLYQWFDPEKIVYHDKRFRDKPFPDQYIVACRLLNKKPEQCLVFEDSVVGITAATNAGIKHIVAVNGENQNLSVEGFSNVHAVIKDFTELNDTMLS